MNTLKGWLLGVITGIGFMGMFINFPLWSDNDGALWLAIVLTFFSCIIAVSSANKEEKTN